MPFSSRSYVKGYAPSNRFPTGLKWLLVANVAIFVACYLIRPLNDLVHDYLGLIPFQVVQQGKIWQLVTYMFVHAGIMHILWNMLGLWMFGIQLEKLWGTAKFLRFYFECGIAAGLTVVVAAYLFGGTDVATVGASGALFGLLVAYAVVFPDQTILFSFLIPIKSKYFVMIIGAIVFLQSYSATIGHQSGTVAVVAHLGGLVAGYLLLRGRTLQVKLRQPVEASFKGWKLRRARKKFEVYLRKQDRNRDRTIH